MSLKVYNTINRKKEEFITIEDKKARMYVCGPTVYNYISIGNARPIIVFSMIRNYLEHSGYSVDFVQNITDIEDKIIRKANEEGVEFNVITERYIKAFLEDIKRLDVGNFTAMPKASEMMPEIISIISRIIENGFGYESSGDVYFDIAKFGRYGRLSGQKTEEMHSQEDDSFSKRSATDFTLWKSAKPGEPFWESPWGKGRPGWHIECSAMSIKYLKYGLDIHGGGIDLIFPDRHAGHHPGRRPAGGGGGVADGGDDVVGDRGRPDQPEHRAVGPLPGQVQELGAEGGHEHRWGLRRRRHDAPCRTRSHRRRPPPARSSAAAARRGDSTQVAGPGGRRGCGSGPRPTACGRRRCRGARRLPVAAWTVRAWPASTWGWRPQVGIDGGGELDRRGRRPEDGDEGEARRSPRSGAASRC